MPSSIFNLERLLAPVTTEDFFARYWERAPLHVSRHEAEAYASLLSVEDAEEIIGAAFARDRASVELLGDARLTGSEEAVQVETIEHVHALRERGATVRVYQVQQLRESVQRLCGELEQTFSFPVRANLYLTPSGSQGAQRHYDTHDVLVLQIDGRKTWNIYPPVFPLPLTHLPPLPFEQRTGALKYRRGGPPRGRASIGDEGAPAQTVTLETGDLLYLPRGYVHEARTQDAPSIHLTLGLHVLTWLDLLSVALGQVANRDERFRRALPIGFAAETGAGAEFQQAFDELMRAFVEEADFRQALDETAESFLDSRMRLVSSSNGDARTDAASLQLDTPLERQPHLVCRLMHTGAMVGLASARGVLWMPASFTDALRFIARTTQLRARDIPSLSEHSQLALARQLVQDGVLRIKN